MSAATNIKQHKTTIHGNEYVMVSGRVLLAHEDNTELSIQTELVLDTEDYVIMKATVITRKGVFCGHATSYKRTGSQFEKKTPLEVAETSSVGRALGFAGYALENGIASADEMDKADDYGNSEPTPLRIERKQVEQQVEAERGTTRADRAELAQQVADELMNKGLDTPDKIRKAVRVLGPDKDARTLSLDEWRAILAAAANIKSRDEALGLVVKYNVAESKRTDDLFDESEEAPSKPQPRSRNQRDEDAENAKPYVKTGPLQGEITEKQIKMIQAITKGAGHEAAIEEYGVGLSELSKEQGSALISKLKEQE